MGITYDATFFVVNPDSQFYRNKRYYNSLQKFLKSIHIPHNVKSLSLESLSPISLKDLKPLERTFNIVILPTRAYYFDLQVHSGKIIIVISHHPGNGSVSWGFYYPAFTLIKKYLFDLKPLSLSVDPYRKLKPEGKALILTLARVLDKDTTWTQALTKAKKLKLTTPLKLATINAIIIKQRLDKLYGENNGLR